MEAMVGPADKTVQAIASKLSPNGLHFAYLDPYNLMTLPFFFWLGRHDSPSWLIQSSISAVGPLI